MKCSDNFHAAQVVLNLQIFEAPKAFETLSIEIFTSIASVMAQASASFTADWTMFDVIYSSDQLSSDISIGLYSRSA